MISDERNEKINDEYIYENKQYMIKETYKKNIMTNKK